MNTPKSRTLSPERTHRKEMLLQVWLPVGLAVLALGTLAVFIVLAATRFSPVVSKASSVSIIFILVPFFIMGVFSAFLIGLAIFLVARLTRKIPPASKMVQAFFVVADHKVSQVTNRAATPFIKTRSLWAAVRKVFHRKR